MYYVDFILNYPNRCIIGVKNLMTVVWKIRIYYYLRCNILMLRLICDHWFLMIDKCGVYVRVNREVSITAGITSDINANKATLLSGFCFLRALSGLHETMLSKSKSSRTMYGFICVYIRGSVRERR